MASSRSIDIEAIYESLAQAIDRAGSANEALVLAKLALALAAELGDAATFERCVEMALQDLPAASGTEATVTPPTPRIKRPG